MYGGTIWTSKSYLQKKNKAQFLDVESQTLAADQVRVKTVVSTISKHLEMGIDTIMTNDFHLVRESIKEHLPKNEIQKLSL